jgi:hypothetical protein
MCSRRTLDGVNDEQSAEYRAGERVRVRRDQEHGPGPWPAEPTGIAVAHPASADGTPWVMTQTVSGPRRSYWIVFDDPQFDADGDGPYGSSEVLEKYLERSEAD